MQTESDPRPMTTESHTPNHDRDNICPSDGRRACRFGVGFELTPVLAIAPVPA